MKLDKKERLQLIYQLKILDKLYPEEEYSNHITALEEGYELHYSWLFENLSDGLTTEQCRNVLDILGVYRAMIFSYEQLENKEGIDVELLRFPGFDGNHETSYMMYVRYFIEELDRFQEIKERSFSGFNSHTQLLDRYNELLKLYNSLEHEHGGLVTRENLMKLLTIAPKGFY